MNRYLPAVACLSAIPFIGTAEETGSPTPPPFIEAVRVTDVITIDGDLSEPTWQRSGMTAFYQRDPDQGKDKIRKIDP